MKPTVIAISGATPYLGGSETWRPLREAATDIEIVAIDPLDFVDAPDLDAAFATIVREYLPSAAAIIAHFSADRAVLDLVRRERPTLPIVLISPCTTFAYPTRMRIVSTLVRRAFVGAALAAFARSKLRRLRASRAAVVGRLSAFVGPAYLDGPLVNQADERVCDARTTRSVSRTAELLREMLRPTDRGAVASARLTVIVGSSPMDRRTARRTRATVVPGVVAAAMIEAPEAVASILREAAGLSAIDAAASNR